MPSAVAQALGVKEAAGQPLLADAMRAPARQGVLLVLDNCEHVLAAVRRPGRGAAARDRRRARPRHQPRAAARRRRADLSGARAARARPTAVPRTSRAPMRCGCSSSGRGRLGRLRPGRPRARAVAEICVRLDGIPLALELAAARVAVLPVEQIVRRLDQRFRLLTGGSRSDAAAAADAARDARLELRPARCERSGLLARLRGVRRRLDAGGGRGGRAPATRSRKDDVVDLLIALVDKSLVVADEDGDRYRLLETVRQYAQDKLAASG